MPWASHFTFLTPGLPHPVLKLHSLWVCVRWVTESCLTLCDPTDCSPPGSSVHGILQARVLQQVAISSSRGSSRPRDGTCVFCISCIGRQILYHCITWEAHQRGAQKLPTRESSVSWRKVVGDTERMKTRLISLKLIAGRWKVCENNPERDSRN